MYLLLVVYCDKSPLSFAMAAMFVIPGEVTIDILDAVILYINLMGSKESAEEVAVHYISCIFILIAVQHIKDFNSIYSINLLTPHFIFISTTGTAIAATVAAMMAARMIAVMMTVMRRLL